MSEGIIYSCLRKGGLSAAGACAMMGNMYAESNCVSYRVQGDYESGFQKSSNYTALVDNKQITKDQFVHHGPGGGGYGLCQWTWYTRKDELYQWTVQKGKSIGDVYSQCDFCIYELKRDNGSLYNYLCGDCDLYSATSRICKEFERPAFNNVDERYRIAKQYYDRFSDVTPEPIPTPTPSPIPPSQSTDSVEIVVRVLRRGDKGRDVFLLQTGMQDMGIDCGIPDGDFGPHTEAAVNDLKESIGLPIDGTADGDVWQIIFQ